MRIIRQSALPFAVGTFSGGSKRGILRLEAVPLIQHTAISAQRRLAADMLEPASERVSTDRGVGVHA